MFISFQLVRLFLVKEETFNDLLFPDGHRLDFTLAPNQAFAFLIAFLKNRHPVQSAILAGKDTRSTEFRHVVAVHAQRPRHYKRVLLSALVAIQNLVCLDGLQDFRWTLLGVVLPVHAKFALHHNSKVVSFAHDFHLVGV